MSSWWIVCTCVRTYECIRCEFGLIVQFKIVWPSSNHEPIKKLPWQWLTTFQLICGNTVRLVLPDVLVPDPRCECKYVRWMLAGMCINVTQPDRQSMCPISVCCAATHSALMHICLHMYAHTHTNAHSDACTFPFLVCGLLEKLEENLILLSYNI